MNATEPLCTLAGRIRRRELRAEAVTEAYLERIAARDPDLGAFLTVDAQGARATARAVDRALDAGQPAGPLAGVPLAIKDILVTRGLRTTCGSAMLRDWAPPYEATAVARLRAAGAVVLGKTNLDEFAMGSSNENSALGPCKNPWDPDRVPGGSSGGSAAAVAAGLCAGALGTDTGGSIRQPAAFCGVVGLKPTYGRVSRHGQVAFASSLDQIGPLTTTVEDAAALLEVIAGHDPRDATTLDAPVGPLRAACSREVHGLRLGVPREYFGPGCDPEVEAAVRAAIDTLGGLGAEVVAVSLPHTSFAVAAYYLICTAEASSNLARFDGVRYGRRAPDTQGLQAMYERTRQQGFGAEVKRRIVLGTFALSAGYYDAYYAKAQRARTLIRRDFEQAFSRCDAIVTPTAPTAAFARGQRLDDPLQMYLADIFTISCNLAGLPGISLPCGFTSPGPDGRPLPIGLQLLGPPLGEQPLLALAAAYERATAWHARRPPAIEAPR